MKPFTHADVALLPSGPIVCAAKTIHISEISVSERLPAAMAIVAESWAEVGFDFALRPDPRQFAAVEAAGEFFALGAFADGELIGYSTAFIGPHHFNPAEVICSTSALFLRRAYRNGLTGGRLIMETERLAKARGANHVAWNTRAGTELAATMAAHGYRPTDIVVVKRLS